ncbi:putative SOS response-associated peptidase YedK [compost metagenome]
MCGRFSQTASPEALALAFGLAEVPALGPRYNIAPSQPIPIIRLDASDRARHLSLARWGLVPGWTKDPKTAPHPINARAESAAEKPTFRDAFRQRRCLIPADGFYEWKTQDAKKQPVRFTMQDDHLFAFAGLWERWQAPDGTLLETATILTTEANALVRPVHDRMPVILAPAAYEAWLDPRLRDPAALMPMLAPYPASEMRSYPVSPKVNATASEGPDLITPQEPGGGQLSLF